MNQGRGRGHGRGCGRNARGGRGAGGGDEEATPEGPQPNVDMAVILAEMQAMQAEMNAMPQAGAGAAVVLHLLVEMLLLVQMMKEV
jgi:hypothetical protein